MLARLGQLDHVSHTSCVKSVVGWRLFPVKNRVDIAVPPWRQSGTEFGGIACPPAGLQAINAAMRYVRFQFAKIDS